jgi:uncharacterized protein
MKQGFRVIDTDLHLAEPPDLWAKRLPASLRSRISVDIGETSNLDVTGIQMRVGDVQWTLAFRLLQKHMAYRFGENDHLLKAHLACSPEVYLEGMDMEGIDLALLVPSLTFAFTTADGLAGEDALAISQVYNDWAAEFCRDNPDRFQFWAWLPRQDPELAAAEAQRCVRDLGAIGVAITSGNVDGRLLCEPSFEPLWSTVQDLDVPLGIHLYGNAPKLHGDPLQRYLTRPRAELAYPPLNGSFQAMTSVTEMIMGGVLERFPRLQPMIMEVGSTFLLWLLQRMDEQWETYEPVMDDLHLSLKPSDYFRRQFTIAVESDEVGLDYLAEACGIADNLVFTTDYPHHDSPFPDAVDNLLGLGLSPALTRKILSENVERLLVGGKASV